MLDVPADAFEDHVAFPWDLSQAGRRRYEGQQEHAFDMHPIGAGARPASAGLLSLHGAMDTTCNCPSADFTVGCDVIGRS